MLYREIRRIMILAVVALMTSCATTSETALQPLKYAQMLTMDKHEGWVEAQIRNPWDTTKVLQHLQIITDDAVVPPSLAGATLIKAPLKHALLMSSVHCSLLAEMQKVNAIGAVCDAGYIKDAALTPLIASKKIADCGNSMEPTQEAIVMANPDAMLISPYKDNDLSRLQQLGIPMIQCADYMEPTALGRAEWVRLYGILFGCENKADSLFAKTEQRYNALKAKTKDVKHRPLVLSDVHYGQVWYVPTVNSTIGRIYADAGAANPFAGIEGNGAAALSPEDVLMKAAAADVWVIKADNAITLESLGAEMPVHKQFKAYHDGNVWQCNPQTTMFYEQSPFHPEMLLEDFIRIFHPELNIGGEMHYYKKVGAATPSGGASN